jgi:O-antigen/teichoic acid export membrane protein
MATIDTPKLSAAGVVGPAGFSRIGASLGSQLQEYAGTFATGFSVLACQLMTYKLAAHFLGKTGFAEYALARRTISILYPMVLLGLGVGLPRYVAMAAGRGEPQSQARYLGATLWCVGLSALLGVAIVRAVPGGLAYLFFGSREYAFLLFPMSLVVAGTALHTVGYSYFRGTLNMRAANLLQLVNLGLMPLAVFFFYGKSLRATLTALGILSIAVAAVALLFTPSAAAIKDNRPQVRELLRFGIQRVPGDFVLMAMLALPATFVAHASGIKAAGFVAFGISMLTVIGAVFAPFGLILLPRAGTLLAAGRSNELRRQVWLLTRVTLAVSSLLTVVIAAGAETLIRLYLGADFSEGAGILRLVLLAAVPYSLYTVVRNVVDAFHELAVTTLILAAGFAIFCLAAWGLSLWQDKLHAVLFGFLGGMLTLALLSGAETLRILRPPPVTGGVFAE